MLSTTDAIVLALQPLSDRAHLLHAYTRTCGRVNYKVYGLGRKHAMGLYNPLSILQITADQLPNRIPSVRSAQLVHVSNSTMVDARKQAIVLFISEVLYITLRHPMEDKALFDFIAESVKWLDSAEEPQNFHLQFLVGLAAQLGFAIDDTSNPDLLILPRTRAERQTQLQHLCAYFAEHVDSWQTPKSLEILMEVFD